MSRACSILHELRRKLGRIVLALVVVLAPCAAPAYSVLAHESVIDSAWKRDITPLILARFPGTSTADLDRARSYAYGSLIQDLGYYPFGNKFLGNLLHYVRRSGAIMACSTSSRRSGRFRSWRVTRR